SSRSIFRPSAVRGADLPSGGTGTRMARELDRRRPSERKTSSALGYEDDATHTMDLVVQRVCQQIKVYLLFLDLRGAFGGTRARAALSAASFARRSSRKRAVFRLVASASRSLSSLKLLACGFDLPNGVSAFRRAADIFAAALLITVSPKRRRRVSGDLLLS